VNSVGQQKTPLYPPCRRYASMGVRDPVIIIVNFMTKRVAYSCRKIYGELLAEPCVGAYVWEAPKSPGPAMKIPHSVLC
jgi:hypothetical protein